MVCQECEREFETLDSLRRHRVQKHHVPAEQTYIDYVLNGIPPICKCGCGERPKFLGIEAGYRDYKWGHAARINNNWGHNPEAIKKSHATQKKMYSTGELTVWNKGLGMDDERVRDNINKVMANPERGNNISKRLTGVPKSAEHKENLSKTATIRWANQDLRDEQSQKRVDWMYKNDYKVRSKLEEVINDILFELGLEEHIDYERWYYIRDIKAFYDFYIFNKKIFIEVDGDFWHCNPNTKHAIPKFASQKKNLNKDVIKTNWCTDHNVKLLRFWESDINNDPEGVISRLKQELGL